MSNTEEIRRTKKNRGDDQTKQSTTQQNRAREQLNNSVKLETETVQIEMVVGESQSPPAARVDN